MWVSGARRRKRLKASLSTVSQIDSEIMNINLSVNKEEGVAKGTERGLQKAVYVRPTRCPFLILSKRCCERVQ